METRKGNMKPSEWLSQIDGHSALNVEEAKADYEKETGEKWPAYLKGTPAKKLLAEGRENYKGLQVWDGPEKAHVAAGWEIAGALADQFVPDFHPQCSGRGSRFREYLNALRHAGK
jgi:hypothetical protein